VLSGGAVVDDDLADEVVRSGVGHAGELAMRDR
jgi:hypothetical protein